MRSTLRWPVVLFDLDGTLIDTIPLIRESHRHALATVLGRELPDDELVAGVGRPLMEQMRTFSEEHAQALYDTYRAWNHANTERLLGAFPGIDGLLLELEAAGARLGVVTSKSRDAVDLAFRVQPPPVVFDALVTVDDTKRHKPDPAPLRHALALLDAAPGDAVYVGDAPYDGAAARGAGIAFVGVAWGVAARAALHDEGAVAVVDDVAGLAGVLLDGGEAGA